MMSRSAPHMERSEVLPQAGGHVRRSRSGHGADLGLVALESWGLGPLFAPHRPLRSCPPLPAQAEATAISWNQ